MAKPQGLSCCGKPSASCSNMSVHVRLRSRAPLTYFPRGYGLGGRHLGGKYGFGRFFAAALLNGAMGRGDPGILSTLLDLMDITLPSQSVPFPRPHLSSSLFFFLSSSRRNFLQRSFHFEDFVDDGGSPSLDCHSPEVIPPKLERCMIEDGLRDDDGRATSVRVNDSSCALVGRFWSRRCGKCRGRQRS